MPRSNVPLALSVVSLTVPESVEATVANLAAFDNREFGFNHDRTWAALPKALRGVCSPAAVAASFGKTPIRVQRCITALCELGESKPRPTRQFIDHPDSGLRTIQSIDWDPNVRIRVKGACWYVENDIPVIPVLQPRKAELSDIRMGIYVRLVRQAFCQGDWARAVVEVIDLSGDNKSVSAKVLRECDVPAVSDETIAQFVNVFVEAKRIADAARKDADKPAKPLPLEHLYK